MVMIWSRLPKTLNGKKIEVPIKKVLMGSSLEDAVNIDSLSNPTSLEFFIEYRKRVIVGKIGRN